MAYKVSTPDTSGEGSPLREPSPLQTLHLRGTAVIGQHGINYTPDRPLPAAYEALYACGCRVFFSISPNPGETLFCRRHDWVLCVAVVGSRLLRCDTCGIPLSLPASAPHLYQAASRHAYGKSGNRNPPHRVLIGRQVTIDDIEWTPFLKEYPGDHFSRVA